MPDPVTSRNLAANNTAGTTLQESLRSAGRAQRESELQRDVARSTLPSAAPVPSTQVNLSPEALARAANDVRAASGGGAPQSVSAPEQAEAVQAPNTENRVANGVASATAPGDQRRAAEVDSRAAELAAQLPDRPQTAGNAAPATVSDRAAPESATQIAALNQANATPGSSAPSEAATVPSVSQPEPIQNAAVSTEVREGAADQTREANARQDASERQSSQAVATARQQATEITQNPFLVGAASTYRSVAEL